MLDNLDDFKVECWHCRNLYKAEPYYLCPACVGRHSQLSNGCSDCQERYRVYSEERAIVDQKSLDYVGDWVERDGVEMVIPAGSVLTICGFPVRLSQDIQVKVKKIHLEEIQKRLK